jgi:hypothetical protein
MRQRVQLRKQNRLLAFERGPQHQRVTSRLKAPLLILRLSSSSQTHFPFSMQCLRWKCPMETFNACWSISKGVLFAQAFFDFSDRTGFIRETLPALEAQR